MGSVFTAGEMGTLWNTQPIDGPILSQRTAGHRVPSKDQHQLARPLNGWMVHGRWWRWACGGRQCSNQLAWQEAELGSSICFWWDVGQWVRGRWGGRCWFVNTIVSDGVSVSFEWHPPVVPQHKNILIFNFQFWDKIGFKGREWPWAMTLETILSAYGWPLNFVIHAFVLRDESGSFSDFHIFKKYEQNVIL